MGWWGAAALVLLAASCHCEPVTGGGRHAAEQGAAEVEVLVANLVSNVGALVPDLELEETKEKPLKGRGDTVKVYAVGAEADGLDKELTLTLDEALGSGSFGTVYSAKNGEEAEANYAVKQIPPTANIEKEALEVSHTQYVQANCPEMSVEILGSNIHLFVGRCSINADEVLTIALKKYRGTLKDNFDRMTGLQKLKAFDSLIGAFKCMHDHDISQLDFSNENALVDQDMRVVVSDFGVVERLTRSTDEHGIEHWSNKGMAAKAMWRSLLMMPHTKKLPISSTQISELETIIKNKLKPGCEFTPDDEVNMVQKLKEWYEDAAQGLS